MPNRVRSVLSKRSQAARFLAVFRAQGFTVIDVDTVKRKALLQASNGARVVIAWPPLQEWHSTSMHLTNENRMVECRFCNGQGTYMKQVTELRNSQRNSPDDGFELVECEACNGTGTQPVDLTAN